MSEIRIGKRQHREYTDYSEIVQQYHRYDVYEDDLSSFKELNELIFSESNKKQLILLSCMNEGEYEELQKSLDNHIPQKRIKLAEQHQQLAKLAEKSSDGKIYPYCVERLHNGVCYPLAVFNWNELEQAKLFARNEFERNIDDYSSVQLSEGLFGKDGDILGTIKTTFVIEEYSNE